MKKKFLVLIPTTFLLFSCNWSFKIKWPWKKDNQDTQQQQNQNNGNNQQQIDDVEPEETTTHATSVSSDPNASFYLKVGETRDLKVSLSPSPTFKTEKTFTWKCSDPSVQLTVNPDDSTKATVTGLKAGEATVTATNDYNKTLVKYFNIKCLDVDEDNVYLWQYKSEDRAQFGYNYSNAKNGTPTGVATLNGKEWSYSRSIASSLQSKYGAVGFGKGESPETLVHLETESTRIVKQIVIETASSNSLAKLTAKVGDTVVLNEVTVEKTSYDEVGTITSELCNAEGKISLDFVTPAYDPSRKDDPSYKAPGAVYLKSILIYYAEEVVDHIEIAPDSKHIVDYTKGAVITYDGLKIDKVTTRGNHLPIDVDEEMEKKNLTAIAPDMNTVSHEGKTVYLSLKVEKYDDPFELEYTIHVRDEEWIPEDIKVVGEMHEQGLIAGDEVSYEGLIIKVVYDFDTNDIIEYPFEDFGFFSFYYGQQEDPFVAEPVMAQGFTIHIQANFGKTNPYAYSDSYVVPAGMLTVQDAIYDRIDFRKAKVFEALKLDSSYKEVDFNTDNGRVTIHFDSVKKADRYENRNLKVPGTNKNISVVVNDSNFCIDQINVNFTNTSSKTNPYSLSESVFGGSIYGEAIKEAENNKIICGELNDLTNAVLLQPGKTSTGSSITTGVGVLSILVRYNENKHVEYSLSTGTTKPVKTTYNEGEVFDPEGVTVTLTSAYEETSMDVTEYVKWYDGATYNVAKQQTLTPSSKKVVGEFNNKTIDVEIENVVHQEVNLTLVTSLDDINDEGHYYLVNRSCNLMCLGSAKSLKNGTGAKEPGSVQLESVNFGQTATLNILYNMDYFNIIKEEGKDTYVINGTNNHGWSVTAGGDSSSTLEPKDGFRSFSLEFDDNGYAIFHMVGVTGNGTKVNKYLGCTDTKFDLYDENATKLAEKLCVSIYKAN